MPHVIVKMYAGHTDAEKQQLADRLSAAVTDTLGGGEEAVSVGIEDIAPADWMKQVYAPHIQSGAGKLFKRPGYGPLR